MNLLSVAELAYRQLFPTGSEETALTREDFIETAKAEYAYQMWLTALQMKRADGEYEVPSYLLTESEPLPIEEGEIDISSLKILRSLPYEMWIQNLGGIRCECQYIKSTMNLSQLLCDDDSASDDTKPFYIIGNTIKFPKGTGNDKELRVIFANNGTRVKGVVEIDDAMAGLIRTKLIDIYGGKIGPQDPSNNSNPQT